MGRTDLAPIYPTDIGDVKEVKKHCEYLIIGK
jgi:hypothetical protein